ncbi:MAG: hypothetical protein L6W00_27070 [Lentisphaeria bacterium]|nr:MAG: hypothetical protein L6W00_27070 [Lentisphaeria bacterium]
MWFLRICCRHGCVGCGSRMGRMAIAQAKKNVREQKTVDGSPMVPRKRRDVRKKMLTGLVKSRWIGMDLPDEDTARVKFFGMRVSLQGNTSSADGRLVRPERNQISEDVRLLEDSGLVEREAFHA